MTATKSESATISCSCGCCQLTLADGRAVCHLRCGCEDCRQAIEFGHLKGGAAPVPLPEAYYMPSDIIDVTGLEHMQAFKLRAGGASTRVYCTKCYAILGIDHLEYLDNVFLSFPQYCQNAGDLSMPLIAYVLMADYSEEIGPLPQEDVPLFTTFRFPQEEQRLMRIPEAANSFKKPDAPPKGMRFSELIDKLGPVTILGLEKGARLLPP